MRDIVSVIIPAYNAAATIDRTLYSVRNQTWSSLEVIVIDDGSTDDTAARVRRHSEEDGRVRLIVQGNGGVARARNRGIEEASSEWIAPVDADDLWHPEKIEQQAAALRQDLRVGLVYCRFAIIDDDDRVIGRGSQALEEGEVVERMCLGNLVGNGSAPLMSRREVLACGGYDPGLRDQKAQGCEDLKLYFALAERSRFALVPRTLLGYRWSSENMSSDGRQMLRSYDLVMNSKRTQYPQFAATFARGRIHMLDWLFYRAVRYGELADARAMLTIMYQQSPAVAAKALLQIPKIVALRRLAPRRNPGPRFLDMALTDGPG